MQPQESPEAPWGRNLRQGQHTISRMGRPLHPELTQSQGEVGRGRREDSKVAAGGCGVLQGDHHLCRDKSNTCGHRL